MAAFRIRLQSVWASTPVPPQKKVGFLSYIWFIACTVFLTFTQHSGKLNNRSINISILVNTTMSLPVNILHLFHWFLIHFQYAHLSSCSLHHSVIYGLWSHCQSSNPSLYIAPWFTLLFCNNFQLYFLASTYIISSILCVILLDLIASWPTGKHLFIGLCTPPLLSSALLVSLVILSPSLRPSVILALSLCPLTAVLSSIRPPPFCPAAQ